MITLLSPHFVPQPVSRVDIIIASLAWGFTIGFGFLTTWTAVRQTTTIFRKDGFSTKHSPYIWMIWLEILVCAIFGIICFLHLNDIIPPSFAFFFVILTTWALQVQFLLQIIINRISILLVDRRKALQLKVGVAILITAINISVYNIWIPARLQVSERYIYINDIWDRCEKIIYLLVDAALNWYFIHTVRERLVRKGLVKYDRLVRFNMTIVGMSLSMDCLIIGMMSLQNSFVYMQFHPLAYMVKLNIEMAMSELIVKVARSKMNTSMEKRESKLNPVAMQINRAFGISTDVKWRASFSPGPWSRDFGEGDNSIILNAKREVHVQVERRKSLAASWKEDTTWKEDANWQTVPAVEASGVDDTSPLRQEDTGDEGNPRLSGRQMGVFTKIWVKDKEDKV